MMGVAKIDIFVCKSPPPPVFLSFLSIFSLIGSRGPLHLLLRPFSSIVPSGCLRGEFGMPSVRDRTHTEDTPKGMRRETGVGTTQKRAILGLNVADA